MAVNLDNALVFLLVMLRMTGVLVFSPILGRSNVPKIANAALAFVLAVLLVNTIPAPNLPDPTLFTLTYWVMKELLIGIIAGVILQLFLSVLIVGGEMADMQMGMSMAKAFDPGSNASISISAQAYNIIFVLVFFASNSHLTLIHMTAQSFEILPVGTYVVNLDAFYMIPEMFSSILLLAIKLSLPILAIEIIVTFAVGIIMRIIPQINVFVVNIQFKLLIGLLVTAMLVPSYAAFMENITQICLENISSVWTLLSQT